MDEAAMPEPRELPLANEYELHEDPPPHRSGVLDRLSRNLSGMPPPRPDVLEERDEDDTFPPLGEEKNASRAGRG